MRHTGLLFAMDFVYKYIHGKNNETMMGNKFKYIKLGRLSPHAQQKLLLYVANHDWYNTHMEKKHIEKTKKKG